MGGIRIPRWGETAWPAAAACTSCHHLIVVGFFFFSFLSFLFFFLFLAQNLTTCEVCGACFETRKGLSSHARSHLRQLGVAESESSGAPIDLLYELMKQKGKPDGSPLSPALGKKSGSPKDATAASPRPTLLALGKAGDRLPDGPVNKAIKSPPGFSKNLSQPGSPILKKVPPALSGSPSPKNPEEKSSKLSLSPLQSSPKAQWPQADEEGPLNLSEFHFFFYDVFRLVEGRDHPWLLPSCSCRAGRTSAIGRAEEPVFGDSRAGERYVPLGRGDWRGRSSRENEDSRWDFRKTAGFLPAELFRSLLLAPPLAPPGLGSAGAGHPPAPRLDPAQRGGFGRCRPVFRYRFRRRVWSERLCRSSGHRSPGAAMSLFIPDPRW